MTYYTSYHSLSQNDLEHHGIKGMHWGVRRFQNKDGSLTSKGRQRYDDSDSSGSSKRVLKPNPANRLVNQNSLLLVGSFMENKN